MPEKQKGLSEAEEKFFNALNDSYDALLEAIRAGTERGYRVSKEFIEQAQKAQREAVELGKKVVEAPTDLAGFYGVLVEATSKAQSRALELAREWLGELGDSGKEARDAIQRVMKANQAAARAAVEAARSGFARAREAAGEMMPKAEETRAGRSDSARPEPAPRESRPEATSESSTTQ
jgi:cellobiose-specific phosphotransferase system component IIA